MLGLGLKCKLKVNKELPKFSLKIPCECALSSLGSDNNMIIKIVNIDDVLNCVPATLYHLIVTTML